MKNNEYITEQNVIHCLIYFRDITDRDLFYILFKNEAKVIDLFLMRDCAWIGISVCIFEPEYEFRIANVLTISTEHPMLPLDQQHLGMCVSSYAAEWTTRGEMQVLFARNADIEIRKGSLIEACGAKMRDGKHEPKDRCNALSAGVPPKLIVRCVVSSTVARGGYEGKNREYKKCIKNEEIAKDNAIN